MLYNLTFLAAYRGGPDMRRANLSKHLHGLLIFTCAICLFPVFPLAANGASLADLTGTWNYNGFVSGPSAPWWERGALTVKPDGTFTGSGKDSNGKPDSLSGAFSISSDGIVMAGSGCSDTPLCRIDSGNTVLVCTHISDAGGSNLTIFTKRAASYSMADLVGEWEADFLSSGPTPWWAAMRDRTYPDGTYKGTLTPSDGPSTGTSGQISISRTGVITCLSGGCLSSPNNYAAFMDANKTVSVGTSGTGSGQDAVFSVFTRKAASYSMSDLAGTWQGSSLASGPGAPWWERDTLTIGADGTFAVSWTASDGSTGAGTGTLSISSVGVITCVSGDCTDRTYMSFMDAGKTVAAGVYTWPDGATREIKIFTKDAVPDVPAEARQAVAPAGSVKVTITPAAAVTAGAKWNVDGGKWQKSGATVSKLSVGSHAVSFKTVTGWNTPSDQSVNISNGKTASASGLYVQQTGSLTVTIGPTNAITAGAKWKVNGGTWQNSGDTVAGLPVGSHKVTFKAIAGWNAPTGQTVTISYGQTKSTDVSYVQQTGSLKGKISPDAAVKAGAMWNVDNGSWQATGTTLSGIAVGSHVVYCASIVGYPIPAPLPVPISNGKTTSVTCSYKLKPGGSLTVTITPAGAVTAGAQWNVDGGAWQNSGDTVDNLSKGSHTVDFSTIAGWTSPAAQTVQIQSGKTATATGVYVQQFGSITVTITPAAAVTAGAQWNVDGGAWQNSGATVAHLSVGNHTVNFKTITNWTTPASQTKNIVNGQTATATGVYTQASVTFGSCQCSYVSGSCPSCPSWSQQGECTQCSVASGWCDVFAVSYTATVCGPVGTVWTTYPMLSQLPTLCSWLLTDPNAPPFSYTCGQWTRVAQPMYGLDDTYCVRGPVDPSCTTVTLTQPYCDGDQCIGTDTAMQFGACVPNGSSNAVCTSAWSPTLQCPGTYP